MFHDCCWSWSRRDSYSFRCCRTLSAFCFSAFLPGPSRILDMRVWWDDSSALSLAILTSTDSTWASVWGRERTWLAVAAERVECIEKTLRSVAK